MMRASAFGSGSTIHYWCTPISLLALDPVQMLPSTLRPMYFSCLLHLAQIDEWDSLTSLETSATITLGTANGYYLAHLEYKAPSGDSAAQSASLSWEGVTFAKHVVPPGRLYRPSSLAPPASVLIRTGALCASTSTFSAPAALQTAPYAATFTITARDEYGNVLDGLADAVPLAVKMTAAFGASAINAHVDSFPAAVEGPRTGTTAEYTASIGMTVSGRYRMLVGGLSGTGFLGVYYKDARCRHVQSATVDTSIDFSWGAGPAVSGGPTTHFCVRWSGFLYVSESRDYDFRLDVDHKASVAIGGRTVLETGTDESGFGVPIRNTVYLERNIAHHIKVVPFVRRQAPHLSMPMRCGAVLTALCYAPPRLPNLHLSPGRADLVLVRCRGIVGPLAMVARCGRDPARLLGVLVAVFVHRLEPSRQCRRPL